MDKQLKKCGITKDKDVSELYLANRQVFVSFPHVDQLKNMLKLLKGRAPLSCTLRDNKRLCFLCLMQRS